MTEVLYAVAHHLIFVIKRRGPYSPLPTVVIKGPFGAFDALFQLVELAFQKVLGSFCVLSVQLIRLAHKGAHVNVCDTRGEYRVGTTVRHHDQLSVALRPYSQSSEIC